MIFGTCMWLVMFIFACHIWTDVASKADLSFKSSERPPGDAELRLPLRQVIGLLRKDYCHCLCRGQGQKARWLLTSRYLVSDQYRL